MLDGVGEHDAAAHAVAEHDALELRVLGGGDADEGVEVLGVLGDVAQIDPLAAGAAVTAQVEGVHDEARFAEPLGDVVVAAGVLGIAVAEHDHTATVLVLRLPHVVDDADTADAVEGPFGSATGHQRRVANSGKSFGGSCRATA